jgi:hypothetical protein
MKVLAAITCSILLTAGCVASPDRVGVTQSRSPPLEPNAVTGTWDFVVTGKQEPQQFSFALTDIPADTCISGRWYQARPISVPRGQVSRPAYQYASGKLEILLSTELCDSYTSFIGNVSGSTFKGAHVSYGLFGSTEHGKVSGALRH